MHPSRTRAESNLANTGNTTCLLQGFVQAL